MFRIGQKVVCISSEWRGGWGDEIDPVKGGVYTIRDIIQYPDGSGLLLVEIVNAVRDYVDGRGEADFDYQKFRPVVERKTDISIFTKMLIGSKISERA